MRHNTEQFKNLFLSSIKMASYITFSRGDQTFSFFLTHAPVLPATVIKATEEIHNKLSNKSFQDDAKKTLSDRLTSAIDALNKLTPDENEKAMVDAKEEDSTYALLWARFKNIWYLPETKNITGHDLSTRILSLYKNEQYVITEDNKESYLKIINEAIDTKFKQGSQESKNLKQKASDTIRAFQSYQTKGDAKDALNKDPVNLIELNQEMIEMMNPRAGKTYWVHGHDSGPDSERIINLDNELGKLPRSNIALESGETKKLRRREDNQEATFCKRSYSTLVIHNGTEQENKSSHTEYKNIWADLQQHPQFETELTENKDIKEKSQLGVQGMVARDTLVLGDMHANALRLVYHLIKHGIFVDVSEETYDQIRDCYHKIDEIYSESSRNITWEIGQQLDEKYTEFYNLIDRLQIREIPINLDLLGDLLCDRGVSDELIRTVLYKLHQNEKINLSIQASNHGQLYLKGNREEWSEQQKSSKNDAAYEKYLNYKSEYLKSLYYLITAGLTGALSITTLILQATGHWAALPSSLAPVLSIGTTTLLGVSGLLLSNYLGYKANKTVGWVAALGTLGLMAMPVLNHMGIVPALAGPLAGSIIKLSIIAAASLAFSMVACRQQYSNAVKSLSDNADKLYVAMATITAVLSITLLVVSSLDQKLLPIFITQALPILSPLATGALGLSGLLLSGYLGKKHSKEVGAAGCAGVMALVAVPLLHHAGAIHWFQTSELSAITLGIIALSAAALFAEKRLKDYSSSLENG